MTGRWDDLLTGIGLSGDAVSLAIPRFEAAAAALRGLGAAEETVACWVPGRIEVLGKHTDYGGGRSLLCAVERGFHVVAAPRDDRLVRLIDVGTGETAELELRADLPSQPGQWTDYPISVIRRLARDAGATRGADIAFSSSLPRASGLSSSSALVIATYLVLADTNELQRDAAWQGAMAGDTTLAGYLGAVENGKAFGGFAADNGVGTHGGSEDQTAILRCRPASLSQYRFLPVEHERTVRLGDDWVFAVAMSGVHAAKGGAAQLRYNHLAGEVAEMLAVWNRRSETSHVSLLAALESSPDALNDLLAWLDAEGPHGVPLLQRLQQFHAESTEIIPAVMECVASGDIPSIGPLVAHSQGLAESTLANQIDETKHLVRTAASLGAAAASAFGAGFGGSVWALVPASAAAAFRNAWRANYVTTFPARAEHADFFLTRPGPAARRLEVRDARRSSGG